jgi:hypothetical protein
MESQSQVIVTVMNKDIRVICSELTQFFYGEISETPAVVFQIINNTCDLTIYQNLFYSLTSCVTETYYNIV